MAAAKQNYRVRSKLEVFYTGGAARLSEDGKLLACACADEVKARAAEKHWWQCLP